jgi:hypothetical protein
MIKTILFVKRKEGFTREQFMKRYEEVHAPLAIKYLPNLKKYTRSYVIVPPGGKEPDFDCITEFWWDTAEDRLKDFESYASGPAREVLPADEEVFMNRGSMHSVVAEEVASKI